MLCIFILKLIKITVVSVTMSMIIALKKDKKRELKKGNFKEAANICNLLGTKLQETGEFSDALLEHEEELNLLETLNDTIGIAVANRRLGEIYSETGQYEKALCHQKKHLHLSQKSGNLQEEQRAYATIGRTHFLHVEDLEQSSDSSNESQEKFLKEAEVAYLKSLEVCQKLTGYIEAKELGKMRSRVYHNLGLVLDSKGNSSKAREFITSALDICKKYSLLDDAYRAYAELSRINLQEGNIEKAKEDANSCVKVAEKLQSKVEQIDANVLMGNLLLHEGNFEMAKRQFFKANKLKHPRKAVRETIEANLKVIVKICLQKELLGHIDTTDEGVLNAYDKLGDYCADLRLYDRAIEFYKKMLDKAIEMNKNKSQLAPIYVSLAQTCKDIKQYRQSIDYFLKELDCRSNSDIKESISTLIELDSLAEIVEKKLHTKYVDHALEIAKKSKCPKNIAYVLNHYISKTYLDEDSKISMTTELSSIVEQHSLEDYDNLSDEDVAHDSDDVDLDDINFSDSDEECVTGGTRFPKRTVLKLKVNEQGETLLHKACIRGQTSLVKRLIAQGHPINPRDNCGWLPLHEACNYGHLEIVEALVAAGAFVNDRGGKGCQGTSPLHDAAMNGHLDVVKVLLANKASVISQDDNGKTPLDCLFIYSEQKDVDEIERNECRELQNILIEKMQSIGCNVPPKYVKMLEDHRNGIRSATVESDSEKENNYDDISPSLNDSLSLPETANESVTESYKDAMKSIGSRAKKSCLSVKKRFKSTVSPLISESDYVVDDWLIEDVDLTTRKRKRSPSYNDQSKRRNDMRKGKQSRINTFIEPKAPECEEVENIPVDYNEELPSICSPVEDGITNEHVVLERSIPTVEPSVSVIPPLRLHIDVLGKKLLVPVAASAQSNPISWLEDEVSKRYMQLEGLRPTLKLLTNKSVSLNSNDLIHMVLSKENNELIAKVMKYDEVLLSERYKEICGLNQGKKYQTILQKLKNAEADGTLDLTQLYSRQISELEPILKTIHYQSITFLNLSNNKLGCAILLEALQKLPVLSDLVLQCCTLTSNWLKDFVNQLGKMSGKCRHVDLSYNEFQEVTTSDLFELCRWECLNSVILKSCQLQLKQAGNGDAKICNITVLNLDCNQIYNDSINSILITFNSLSHLSLANSIDHHLDFDASLSEFLGVGDHCAIVELNLSGCNISNTEMSILSSYIYRCVKLKSLNISYNNKLSLECIISLLGELTKTASSNSLEVLHLSEISSLHHIDFLHHITAYINKKHTNGCNLQYLSFPKQISYSLVKDAWVNMHGSRSIVKETQKSIYCLVNNTMA